MDVGLGLGWVWQMTSVVGRWLTPPYLPEINRFVETWTINEADVEERVCTVRGGLKRSGEMIWCSCRYLVAHTATLAS